MNQQNQQQMEKHDNISKVKSLLGPLRESLKNVFSAAANLLTMNNNISNG
jgi:mediator of RNA polymerase II transcription subunit 29